MKLFIIKVSFACVFLFLIPFNVTAFDNQLIAVSSYITSVQDQDQGVKTNLQLACKRLHGYVILPHSIFSFNDVVGEGSAKNGYVNGRVLYRDEVRFEPGGGLCQVSTTLYNALLTAGFNIIERHRHFQPVTYVPLGLDATIKYGKKNLRMKNPHNQKFYIETVLTDKSMSIVLKTEAPLPYRYEMITDEEDVDLPINNKSLSVRQGISIFVIRNRYSENKLLDSATLYKDYYPPVYLK